MDIEDLRHIGSLLHRECTLHLKELRSGASLGRGAGGDTTHLIDRRAEEIIVGELNRMHNPVTLISEECGQVEFFGGGPKLLVDPVDGSRNAVSGVPLFSTSIALVEGDTVGDTSLGYVINLVSGDEYWAEAGRGCFVNGLPAKVQTDGRCRVLAYEAQSPGRDVARIMPLIALFNRARCFGSTALDMAFLASGSVSVFVVPSPSRSFDFTAGHLLIREAGGIITDLDGRDIGTVEVGLKRACPLLAAANATLHEQALSVLLNAAGERIDEGSAS